MIIGLSGETKVCSRCREEKPVEEFWFDSTRKGGRYPQCQPCSSAAKAASRKKNPPDNARYQRTYKERHPERVKQSDRKKNLKKFGITPEEYDALLEAQGGHCAVCPRTPDEHHRSFPVDHCHATGRIRAILCDQCNTALGLVNDDVEILRRLIEYLEKHQ